MTAPLSEAARLDVADGILRCYELAGLPPPERVIWVPSPRAGWRRARRLARRHAALPDRWRAWRHWVREAIPYGLGAAMVAAWAGLACGTGAAACAFMTALGGVATSVHLWIGEFGLAAAVALTVYLAWTQARAGAREITIRFGATFFYGLFASMVGIFVAASVRHPDPAPTLGRLLLLLFGMMVGTPLVCAAVGFVLHLLPYGGPPPIANRARGRIVPPMWRAESDGRLARSDLEFAIRGAVEEDAEDGCASAPRQLAMKRQLTEWMSGREAWVSYAPLTVPGDVRLSALAGVGAACRWWPHSRFAVVAEPPAEICTENVGGKVRPHSPDGPAVRWPDGYGLYFWHGVRLPRRIVESQDVRAIHRLPNTEVRRAAIERIGWPAYIARAGWKLIATAGDPGNAPHELSLYDDPRHQLGDIRVLVMTNGSPDRSGRQVDYAETVPGIFDDPVAAAAWQYGCSPDTYRKLERRT